jgi:hypothetical protein
LLVTLGFGPGRGEVSSHQLGIDAEESAADVLREGEVGVEIAGVQPIVEDAADAAHLAAMLQVEIFIAPFFEFVVGRDGRMRIARRLHGGVKGGRVGIVLGAPAIEHRREVDAAAEPRLGGDDVARVHVDRRNVRVVHVRDQRDA